MAASPIVAVSAEDVRRQAERHRASVWATSRSQKVRIPRPSSRNSSRGERIRTSQPGGYLAKQNSDFARSQVVTWSTNPGSSRLVPALLVFLGNGCLPMIARGSPRALGSAERAASPEARGQSIYASSSSRERRAVVGGRITSKRRITAARSTACTRPSALARRVCPGLHTSSAVSTSCGRQVIRMI
jgi:hypothetical protein